MIPNDDKTKLKEGILEKLEEIRKMIYEYIGERGWHDMDDDTWIHLRDVRDILELNILYSNCASLKEIAKESL